MFGRKQGRASAETGIDLDALLDGAIEREAAGGKPKTPAKPAPKPDSKLLEGFGAKIASAREEQARIEALKRSEEAGNIARAKRSEQADQLAGLVVAKLTEKGVPFDGTFPIEIHSSYPRHRVGFLKWGIFSKGYEERARELDDQSSNQRGYWDPGITTETGIFNESFAPVYLFASGEMHGSGVEPYYAGIEEKLKGLANLVVRFDLDIEE